MLNRLQELFSTSELFKDTNLQTHQRSKRHRQKGSWIKIGQGGTLDPLAKGVLVIGIGRGTKKLNKYLESTKVGWENNAPELF